MPKLIFKNFIWDFVWCQQITKTQNGKNQSLKCRLFLMANVLVEFIFCFFLLFLFVLFYSFNANLSNLWSMMFLFASLPSSFACSATREKQDKYLSIIFYAKGKIKIKIQQKSSYIKAIKSGCTTTVLNMRWAGGGRQAAYCWYCQRFSKCCM